MNVPEEARDYEQQSSRLSYSQLDFILEGRYPKSFGWLTESGIFFGELSQMADSPNFILNKKTLAFPEIESEFRSASYMSKQNQVPSSFVLTKFHLLLQYSDHVTGISLINHQVVYDEYIPEQNGKLSAIVKDSKNGNVYTFTNKTIFRYQVSWKLLLICIFNKKFKNV